MIGECMNFMQGVGRFGDIAIHSFNATVPASRNCFERAAMRLVIEIIVAAFLVLCIGASSAAFAADRIGRSADGLSCSFSVPQDASPAARCVAMRRQCGGKFYANYCGGRLVSAAN